MSAFDRSNYFGNIASNSSTDGRVSNLSVPALTLPQPSTASSTRSITQAMRRLGNCMDNDIPGSHFDSAMNFLGGLRHAPQANSTSNFNSSMSQTPNSTRFYGGTTSQEPFSDNSNTGQLTLASSQGQTLSFTNAASPMNIDDSSMEIGDMTMGQDDTDIADSPCVGVDGNVDDIRKLNPNANNKDCQTWFPHNHTVFVANLDRQKSDEIISQQIFDKFWELGCGFSFLKVRRTQEMMPHAFVTFSQSGSAEIALDIAHKSGIYLFGRKIRVERTLANCLYHVSRRDNKVMNSEEVHDVMRTEGDIAHVANVRNGVVWEVEYTFFAASRNFNHIESLYKVNAVKHRATDASAVTVVPASSSPAKDRNLDSCVLVTGAPADFDKLKLRAFLQSRLGHVVSLDEDVDRITKMPVAIAEFSTPEEAQDCIINLNNLTMGSATVYIGSLTTEQLSRLSRNGGGQYAGVHSGYETPTRNTVPQDPRNRNIFGGSSQSGASFGTNAGRTTPLDWSTVRNFRPTTSSITATSTTPVATVTTAASISTALPVASDAPATFAEPAHSEASSASAEPATPPDISSIATPATTTAAPAVAVTAGTIAPRPSIAQFGVTATRAATAPRSYTGMSPMLSIIAGDPGRRRPMNRHAWAIARFKETRQAAREELIRKFEPLAGNVIQPPRSAPEKSKAMESHDIQAFGNDQNRKDESAYTNTQEASSTAANMKVQANNTTSQDKKGVAFPVFGSHSGCAGNAGTSTIKAMEGFGGFYGDGVNFPHRAGQAAGNTASRGRASNDIGHTIVFDRSLERNGSASIQMRRSASPGHSGNVETSSRRCERYFTGEVTSRNFSRSSPADIKSEVKFEKNA